MGMLRTAWLSAMGVDGFLLFDWGNKDLYRRLPHRCQICGRKELPGRDDFVAVLGRVVARTEAGDTPIDEWLVTDHGNHGAEILWVETQLGIEKPTGHAKDHIRYICKWHGGKGGFLIRDVCTNEVVYLRPETAEMAAFRVVNDVLYWIEVMGKFPRELFLRWWGRKNLRQVIAKKT